MNKNEIILSILLLVYLVGRFSNAGHEFLFNTLFGLDNIDFKASVRAYESVMHILYYGWHFFIGIWLWVLARNESKSTLLWPLLGVVFGIEALILYLLFEHVLLHSKVLLLLLF